MKSKFLVTLFALSALVSCDVNQSVNKDISTGAYTRGDGLSCDKVRIQIQEKTQSRNTFYYGEKVHFVFNNVKGLKEVNGLRFPVMAMHVIKNDQDTVLSNTDLLTEMKGGTKLFPLKLSAHFIAGLPYKNGEKYKLSILITDGKGDGKLVHEMPFTITESKNLEVIAAGIDYTSVYLWDNDDKFAVTGKTLQQDRNYLLIISGIDGLDLKEENVFPKLAIELKDRNGRKMINNPNILSDYFLSGMNAEEFKSGKLPITLSFTSGNVANPCVLTAFLEDQLSTKKLRIRSTITIKENDISN